MGALKTVSLFNSHIGKEQSFFIDTSHSELRETENSQNIIRFDDLDDEPWEKVKDAMGFDIFKDWLLGAEFI